MKDGAKHGVNIWRDGSGPAFFQPRGNPHGPSPLVASDLAEHGAEDSRYKRKNVCDAAGSLHHKHLLAVIPPLPPDHYFR